MPIFDYKAYDRSGKIKKGVVEAESAKAGRLKLKKQSLMVTEISEKTSSKPGSSGGSIPFVGGKVGIKDLALITRQLASLVKANIPLVDSLNALIEQTEHERLKVVLSEVRQDVNEGSALAKALEKHPKVFDHIYINMVEAGESSGTLGLVLIKLADLKEAQMRLKSKVTSAMMYPSLMMGVAFFLMLGIFTFVVPQLAQVFESQNKEMPPMTVFMMTVSGIITEHWALLALGAFIGFILFNRYINTKGGRRKWDAFKLKSPLFGSLFRMISVTRFANTMGTLLASGVPILTAMNIAKNLVGNVLIQRAVEQARENITEGQSIAEPLKKSGAFPPMVIHMIAIGEKTGELPEMLHNVSNTYEAQINSKVESLTSLLEPIMIVAMGIGVTFIVVTIFLPLLDISNIQS